MSTVLMQTIIAAIVEYLQGQGAAPHCWLSVAGPEHGNPPLDGGGLVQVRVLVWVPPPHVTVQEPQALQSDQPPSTEIGRLWTKNWN